jgi:hypothetical protein
MELLVTQLDVRPGILPDGTEKNNTQNLKFKLHAMLHRADCSTQSFRLKRSQCPRLDGKQLNYTKFQVSAAVQLRASFFTSVTLHWLVATVVTNLQGSCSPGVKLHS